MTDTPGLLRRPEGERNAMERLTLAALAHLPTAAVFVADLTGECGTSVPDQWAIRCECDAPSCALLRSFCDRCLSMWDTTKQ